jgi:curved DNA-binding protein CbpA
MSDPTHYEMLGIERTATIDEVRLAARRRAKQTHPDAGGDRDDFDRVQLARATLGDARLRREYDRQLTRVGLVNGAPSAMSNQRDPTVSEIVFAGQTFHDPISLVETMRVDWELALEGLADDDGFRQRLMRFLGRRGVTQGVVLLLARSKSPSQLLAELVRIVTPHIPPVWKGFEVDPPSLLWALENRPTAHTVAFIRRNVLDDEVLLIWAGLPGMDGSEELDVRLRQATRLLDRNADQLVALGARRVPATAAVLAAAARNDTDQAHRAALALPHDRACRPSWWTEIAIMADRPDAIELARQTVEVAIKASS